MQLHKSNENNALSLEFPMSHRLYKTTEQIDSAGFVKKNVNQVI